MSDEQEQMITRQMYLAHPLGESAVVETVVACIDACLACAQACTACADACLAEDDPADLRRCIRLTLECADICFVTARMATRRTEPEQGVVPAFLQACAAAAAACGDECARHADRFKHCRICSEVCGKCEHACKKMLATTWIEDPFPSADNMN